MRLQTIIGEMDVRFRYGFKEAKAPVFAVRGVDCDLRAPGWTSDVWSGGAYCDSRAQFVKATGRKIALAKAMHGAGLWGS